MVDEEIVVSKLRYINEYTNDLREMQWLPKDEYKSDMIIQRAVERTCMNLVQACIDLAKHIRAAEDLSPRGTSKQNIEALGNAGIISSETQKRLEEAVGFKNILAHRYGDVNHDIVYDVLHNDLPWFEQFQQELAQWFQQQ